MSFLVALPEKIHRKLRTFAPWLFGIGLLAFVFLKAPLLKLPFFWDEIVVYAHPAQLLLQYGLRQAHPFFRANPSLFFGHPPAYATSIAVLYRIFGSGPPVARTFALALSCAGLAATYRLVAREIHPLAGLVAALLLGADPYYFVQSTQILSDVAQMSLFPVLLCLAAEGRLRWYALLAIYVILTKETALTAITAIPLAHWWCLGRPRKATLAAYALPFVALTLYFLDEKVFTGHFSNWPPMADNFIHGASEYLPTLKHHVFFSLVERRERYPFLVVGVIGALCAALFRKLARRNAYAPAPKPTSWIAWACVFNALFLLLGKSLLAIVNEHYFIMLVPCLVIGSALFLAPLWRRLPLLLATLCVLFVVLVQVPRQHRSNPETVQGFGFEGTMAYVDMIQVQEEAVHYVVDHFPHAIVNATWPVNAELTLPEAGYVQQPLAVVKDIHTDPFQVLVWAESSVPVDYEIQRSLIRQKHLQLARRFERNGRWVDVYVEPGLAIN